MTLPKGVFVFTSNVDGLFQRAGFDDTRVSECHGSIHQLQCLRPCSDEIWPADKVIPKVDESACRLLSPLPRCPGCGGIARPNILMFGDSGWIETRWLSQNARLYDWLGETKSFVVIELGAGKHIPTVREFGQSICHKHACPMIRINPTEPDLGPLSGISLPMRALAALRGIGGSLDAVSPIE
jgi:NAD-dependent SIR2 family protein deacetylase